MPTPPVPQHCPSPVELDDLELLLNGSLGELSSFNRPGSPVTLALPDAVSAEAQAAGAVELVDPEGLPLARVSWPDGRVDALAHAQYGPFRSLMVPPDDYHREHGGRVVVPVDGPLTTAQVAAIGGAGRVTLLTFAGTGWSSLSPVALVRATRASAALLPDAVVIITPLARHADVEGDRWLRERIISSYAGEKDGTVLELPPSSASDVAYPPAVATIVDHDHPPRDRQGLVLFFTGLSGSGKSTLARALVDLLLEKGDRTVTSLDGDVVRRSLSAGLTFSREDRETNIRRIGWVAAEIARHGGVAVVSPIAPFDETRQQVRQTVEAAGGAFYLIHVATPLEECERRDRKGLYAKARQGVIPEFTGISSPYEVPTDADVRVDTTGLTIDEALSEVLVALRDSGYLDLVTGATVDETTPRTAGEPQLPPVVEEGPLKVLFVCTANICRSPSMELLARRAQPDASAVVFSSAGTRGFVDRGMDEVMRLALPPGVDGTGFRSRQLTPELLEEADVVLTAESDHRVFVLDDHPGMLRKVFTLGQFVQAVEKAPPGLAGRALLTHVGDARGTADTSLDVVDPYGHGPARAAECMRRLQSMLDVVLPALAS